MKVYVVRHGESEANLKRFFAGWAPVSLTEKGVKDAESIREFMQSIHFDKIYSSDLIRAIQTTETVLPGCEYEIEPLLREINVGNLMYKDVLKCDAEMGETLTRNRTIWDYTPYGGENLTMLRERAAKFLKKLEDENYDTVAVFAHEGMLKSIFFNVIGAVALPKKLKCVNCSVVRFEYTDGMWFFTDWVSPEIINNRR